jgi:hypothetical protein
LRNDQPGSLSPTHACLLILTSGQGAGWFPNPKPVFHIDWFLPHPGNLTKGGSVARGKQLARSSGTFGPLNHDGSLRPVSHNPLPALLPMTSRLPVLVVLTALAALAAIEGLAWWWMNPPPAGQGAPVLAFRPGILDHGSGIFSSGATASSITALPEIVSRSIPSLLCSNGTALRIDRDDGVIVHVAFFEWNHQSSANVLESFKHLPDECLGAIGMSLVKKHPQRLYVIETRESEACNHVPPSSFSLSSATGHSLPNEHSLLFDHTEFLDHFDKPVHAFKAVWVSGAVTLLGDGLRGGLEQSSQIRWRAATNRFRPAHARVAQGAVHSIANPDRAWEIFQETMLRDLTFE